MIGDTAIAFVHFKLARTCQSLTFREKHNDLDGFAVLPRVGEKFKFFDDPMVYKVLDILHEAGYQSGNLNHRVTITLIC
jgi:hypothetical protein